MVTGVDKYEFKLKVDEMKALVSARNYNAAAEIAETINWRKIRNLNALVLAGEVFEQVGRYEDSKEILLLAYDKSPIGRNIIYRLAEIAIKTNRFDEAQEYYDEFVDIAPHDNLKYVLKYKMTAAQGLPYKEQINILEELKEQEYSEEWAYELAYLYHKDMQPEKCVEACDELILWFGDGIYVEKALELKMHYQPLSRPQEEKYHVFRQKRTGIIEVKPDDFLESGEIVHEAVEIPSVQTNTGQYNTANLQKEIAKGMQQIQAGKQKQPVQQNAYMDQQQSMQQEMYANQQRSVQQEMYANQQQFMQQEMYVNQQSMQQNTYADQLQQSLHKSQSILQNAYAGAQKQQNPYTASSVEKNTYTVQQDPYVDQPVRQVYTVLQIDGFRQQNMYAGMQMEGTVQQNAYTGVRTDNSARQNLYPDMQPGQNLYADVQLQQNAYPDARFQQNLTTDPQEQEPAAAMTMEEIQAEWEKTKQEMNDALQEAEGPQQEESKERSIEKAEQLVQRLLQMIPQLAEQLTRQGQTDQEPQADLQYPSKVQQDLEQAGRIVAGINQLLQDQIDHLKVETTQEHLPEIPAVLDPTREMPQLPEDLLEGKENGAIGKVQMNGNSLNKVSKKDDNPVMSAWKEATPGISAIDLLQRVRMEKDTTHTMAQAENTAEDPDPVQQAESSNSAIEVMRQMQTGNSAIEVMRQMRAGSAGSAIEVLQQMQGRTGNQMPQMENGDIVQNIPAKDHGMEMKSTVQVQSAGAESAAYDIGERAQDDSMEVKSSVDSSGLGTDRFTENRNTGIEYPAESMGINKAGNVSEYTGAGETGSFAENTKIGETGDAAVNTGLKTDNHIAAAIGNSVEDTGMGFGNSMENTEMRFQNPMEHAGMGFDNSMKNTGMEFQNPVENTDMELRNSVEHAGMEFQNPVNNTGMEFQSPVEHAGMEFQNPVGNADMGLQNPVEHADIGLHNSMEHAEMEFQNPMENTGMGFHNSIENTDIGFYNSMEHAGTGFDNSAEDIGTGFDPLMENTGIDVENQSSVMGMTGTGNYASAMGVGAGNAASAMGVNTGKSVETGMDPGVPVQNTGMETGNSAENYFKNPDRSREYTELEDDQDENRGQEENRRGNAEPESENEQDNIFLAVKPRFLTQAQLQAGSVMDGKKSTQITKEFSKESMAAARSESFYDRTSQTDSQDMDGMKQLTPDQKQIFSYFVPIAGMEAQIYDLLMGVSEHLQYDKHALSGNIIIEGISGSGKTVLIMDIIKALQKEIRRPAGKTGKIDANALNQKDLDVLIDKICGGCLIIESAGKISRETAVKLSKCMERDHAGTLYIIEDTEEGIQKALDRDSSFAAKFTEKISIPLFSSDELVEFGKAYANDLNYDIDEMGVLALYKRISAIQKLDHVTTLTEVKEIVDEAIDNAEKGVLKKVFGMLTATRANDDNYIILREKDFEES